MNSGQECIELGTHLHTIKDLESDHPLIETKLEQLRHLCTDYTQQYTECSKKLNKSVAFLTLLKTAEQWSISVLEFLAHMNMEDIQTQEGIQRLKMSLDEFAHAHPEIEESKVVRMTELAHHLGHQQVTKAEQVNGRCSEVKNMLSQKMNQILGAEKRIKVIHYFLLVNFLIS